MPAAGRGSPKRHRVVERDAQGRVFGEGDMEGTRHVGRWRTWHPNGALYSEGGYEDGLLHGAWTYWSPGGTRLAQGAYRHGQRHGAWRTWYESGGRESAGGWNEGAREGPWRTWSESGELSSRGRYRLGRREGRWYFDGGGGGFETLWFQGALTDRRGGPPRQPLAQRDHYYPVVPGQRGFETPFDEPGHAAGLCFGYVEGAARFTCLFHPRAPVNQASAGGLFLAIAERRRHLWLLEKRFAARPGSHPVGRVRARAYRPSGFFVFADPGAAGAPGPVARPTLAAAVREAREGVGRDGVPRVVGALLGQYPLDF